MSEREEAIRLAKEAGFSMLIATDGRSIDVLVKLIRLARVQPHSRQEGEISERPAGGASNADSGSPPPQQEPVAWMGRTAGSNWELEFDEHEDPTWTKKVPLYAYPPAIDNYEPCLSVGRCRWNEQAAPEGLVLVPMEPPQEMLDAWTRKSMLRASARECYQSMLSAAPKPCIGNDPACPCQDGLACHYRDAADGTKAWPLPNEPKPEGE